MFRDIKHFANGSFPRTAVIDALLRKRLQKVRLFSSPIDFQSPIRYPVRLRFRCQNLTQPKTNETTDGGCHVVLKLHERPKTWPTTNANVLAPCPRTDTHAWVCVVVSEKTSMMSGGSAIGRAVTTSSFTRDRQDANPKLLHMTS